MSKTLKLCAMELKLYLREPSAFFFTLIFPLLLMLLFGSIWGNDPFPEADYGYIDAFTSAFIGIVILTAGISNLTIGIATYREKGILKRFRAAPISPVSFLLAQMGAILAVSAMGVILLLIAGKVIFHMQFRGNPLEAFTAFILSCCGIAGLGFIPASLARTARSGTVIANSLYFPMLFLSGAALPRQMLPDILKKVSEAFPLTHSIRMMQGIWLGDPITEYWVEMVVLGATLALGGFFAGKLFRWD